MAANQALSLRQQISKEMSKDDIAKAEKQGFSAPDASWFKGESIDFVREDVHGGVTTVVHRGPVTTMYTNGKFQGEMQAKMPRALGGPCSSKTRG